MIEVTEAGVDVPPPPPLTIRTEFHPELGLTRIIAMYYPNDIRVARGIYAILPEVFTVHDVANVLRAMADKLERKK